MTRVGFMALANQANIVPAPGRKGEDSASVALSQCQLALSILPPAALTAGIQWEETIPELTFCEFIEAVCRLSTGVVIPSVGFGSSSSTGAGQRYVYMHFSVVIYCGLSIVVMVLVEWIS